MVEEKAVQQSQLDPSEPSTAVAAEVDRTDGLPALIRRLSAAVVPETAHEEEKVGVVARYSAFSKRQRLGIIALASFGSIWSPFTNVYFPAIPSIATDLNATIQSVNLTVVVYLVAQGIAPSFWAAMADVLGRRPVYIGIYIAATAGLSVCPSLSALYGLRAMQAAGSASTIALGAAVVGDVTPPSQRGLVMGLYSVMLQTVLLVGVALCTAAIVLVLPETVRNIVGDGSKRPPALNIPVVRSLCSEWAEPIPPRESWTHRLRRVDIFGSLLLLREPDLALVLAWQGLSYAFYTLVVVSLATLVEERYGLSTLQASLCYLANGLGTVCAGPFCGILLNRSFRNELAKLHARKRADAAQTTDVDEKAVVLDLPTNPADVRDLSDFPIELARLKVAALCVPLYTIALLGFGWTVEYSVNLAAPLFFQVLLGIAFALTMSSAGTLCVDLVPKKAASVTASQNLVRCLLGACSTSVTDPMLTALGPGRTMSILAGFTVAISSFLAIDVRYGPRWRAQRKARLAVAPS